MLAISTAAALMSLIILMLSRLSWVTKSHIFSMEVFSISIIKTKLIANSIKTHSKLLRFEHAAIIMVDTTIML